MRVVSATSAAISVPVWEAAVAAEMSAQEGVEVTLPGRAYQVTVRYFSVSGHDHRDVVLFADDYLRRKEDGSLDAYLEARVIPRLKREWYPFPVDPGDRWVLPVLLVDGAYVADHDAPDPLDSYSVSFGPVAERITELRQRIDDGVKSDARYQQQLAGHGVTWSPEGGRPYREALQAELAALESGTATVEDAAEIGREAYRAARARLDFPGQNPLDGPGPAATSGGPRPAKSANRHRPPQAGPGGGPQMSA
jgi:hypothetical protein